MRKPVDMTKFASSVTKKLNVSYGFNDPKIWVDTGNYMLNYLISGDFHKGIPLSKVSMFAGASGSGKSLIVSGMLVKHAQEMGIIPVLFDSENALDEDWLKNFGIDTSPEKILRFQVSMINDVGKIMSEFIKDYRANYSDLDPEERPCFLFVIDSLGMLLTDTDVDQFNKGDMKGDMGRKPKQLNALVRNLVNQIADLNIGVVCTNHTYASQDMFDPDDKISGGNGFIFASSIVVASQKLKLKEDDEGNKTSDVHGIKSAIKIMKSRYGRAYETCKIHIRFDSGLDRYSGLFEYIEQLGVIERQGNKYKYVDKEGVEHSEFRKNFGPELLEKIVNEWDYDKYKLLSNKVSLEEEREMLGIKTEEKKDD